MRIKGYHLFDLPLKQIHTVACLSRVGLRGRLISREVYFEVEHSEEEIATLKGGLFKGRSSSREVFSKEIVFKGNLFQSDGICVSDSSVLAGSTFSLLDHNDYVIIPYSFFVPKATCSYFEILSNCPPGGKRASGVNGQWCYAEELACID